MEEITVTESRERNGYITYLYNALLGDVLKSGGSGALLFSDDRTALRITGASCEVRALLREKISEIVGVGYKYRFLSERLQVCLGAEERKLLLSALISADLEGDKAYIRSKMEHTNEYAVDGIYAFRLAPLREKWERIARYVPLNFSSDDLKQFCSYLVEESSNRVYVQGERVFGENFIPLKRSRLTGEESVEAEIMLSDAGFVYCLGEVAPAVGDFLQKYYAERAIFS